AGMPEKRLGEIEEGPVRVSGFVQPRDQLLRAPMSDRACVAYALEVQREGGRGIWFDVLDLRDVCTFDLIDRGDRVLVAPDSHYGVALIDAQSWKEPKYVDERNRLHELLEQHDVALQAEWFDVGYDFRYREAVLRPGESVSVGGCAVREVDPHGTREGLRSPPTSIVIRGTESVPVLLSEFD
ncbi:MAG TPA: hypothetical protein VGF45_17795, partial [Polyangia bacterium]